MTVVKPKTPGLIDTISAGYSALNRRLWVLGIPVALNLYLWLGAPLSLAPFLGTLHGELTAFAALFAPDPLQREEWVFRLLHTDMRSWLAQLNFVPLLSPQSSVIDERTIYVSEIVGVIVAVLLINLCTLLLSSLFLAILSGAVRNERFQPIACLRQTPAVALGICSYLVVLAGVGLLLALPFVALSLLVIALAPDTTLLVVLVWYVILFWVYVYTGFAVEALLISNVGPLRAIYNSVAIVRRNLASTLGLLLINFLILAGLSVVWQYLTTTFWGLLAAMTGSAYIGSGLAAARLTFYKERLALISQQAPATSR